MTLFEFPLGPGVHKDSDIVAALSWLAECSDAPHQFWKRLENAQQTYRNFVAKADAHGSDPAWTDLGTDRVAAFFAQAKSLLDDRASYDFALVAHVAPWLKQLGVNLESLRHVSGAEERARRMLRNATVLPDTSVFELVMAGNYAAEGFDVSFIREGSGKTPDLRLWVPGTEHSVVVELKRLQRGQYEIDERKRHSVIFRHAEKVISKHRLSVDIDVTYDQELVNVPDGYLAQVLERFLANPIALPGGYPWKDAFGSGTICVANIAAVRHDIQNSYLYFGTKLARLLSGRRVFENNYHLAADATPYPKDPRYIDKIHYGSVVSWKSASSASLERKARYVRTKLVEADQQIVGHGRGIIHIAMDVEQESEASDLRRRRNTNNLRSYQMASDTTTVYLHYFVPRISEDHAWMTDETVDVFSRFAEPPPAFPAFPDAPKVKNTLPAWRQPPSSSL